jgi:archaeal flagellin FlaB
MRKFLFFNKKKDFGAIGIGAMIVLIAMILVAGVAASVLISTSATLQTQAMRTGSQTIREVVSGLYVYGIDAWVDTNGSEYNNITCLAITVEVIPGSDGVDLNNTFILLSNGEEKALLSYAHHDTTSFYNQSVTGSLFDSVVWGNLGADEFAIAVIQDYDYSLAYNYNPVLNRGDKAVLFVHTNVSAVFNKPISERMEIFGQIIPEFGSPGVISFTSPKAYTASVYNVQ